MSANGCQNAMARQPSAARTAGAASRTASRAIAVVCQRQKPWIVPSTRLQRDRHAGALERGRVGLALVAQDVVAGGDRRTRAATPLEVVARSGEASGSQPVGAVQVEVPEAPHRGRGEAEVARRTRA